MTIVRRDLALLKSRAIAQANLMIAEVRKQYITVIPGQEMIYIAKEREAEAYLADGAPNMANYPMLTAEIGTTAPDATSLAQLWQTMSTQWRQVAAVLEGLRMASVNAISAATTVTQINTALIELHNNLENL